MRSIITLMLLCSSSWAQATPATQPTTRPIAKPSRALKTSYDRFRDSTSVVLTIHGQIWLAFAYAGKERRGWPTEALLFTGRRDVKPSEAIFLVNGERLSFEFEGNAPPALSFEALTILSKAKTLEVAIISPRERTEITFNATDIEGLRQFVEASGYSSSDAIALRRKAAEIAARPPIAILGDVAYILDGTGSMLNQFDSARVFVRKSIEHLGPKQSFAIVVYQDNASTFTRRAATQENKKEAYTFLDKLSVRGGTDAEINLVHRAALEAHPKSMIFVSDCDLTNDGQIPVFLRHLEAEHIPMHVALIQDVRSTDPDDVAAKGRALATTIAKKSGGTAFRLSNDRPILGELEVLHDVSAK
jgi:hypothetical protein